MNQQLVARVAAGQATDAEFDALLPAAARELSQQFWSPVAVGYRVAEWLHQAGVASLVDIGSGVGKLCAVVALRSEQLSGQRPALQLTGIEQRASLVAMARDLSAALGISERVSFTTARITEVEAAALTSPDCAEEQAQARAQAFYLYNPFGENLSGAGTDADRGHIDDEFPRSEEAFVDSVRATERVLRDAPAGTQLITFNGFGGVIPKAYDARAVERHGLSDLIWWSKRGATRR